MVTALGLDWENSCAASRAGVLRVQALDHFRVQGIEPTDVEFVAGHEADLLTRGFEGKARLLRLLTGAFKDLRERLDRAITSLPVFLSLPGPERVVADEESGLDAMPSMQPLKETASVLVLRAAVLAKWSTDLRIESISTGNTSVAEALRDAGAAIGGGGAQYALIVAVDSLLDDWTLAWLHSMRRLKTPAVAAGLMPGEAAVAILVTGAPRTATSMGMVESLAFGGDAPWLDSDRPVTGRGTSTVIARLAAEANWPRNESPWLLSDHNGEYCRANDFGGALHRLVKLNRAFSDARIWHPAISFGDTASASGAVSIAAAAAAWKRNYAPSRQCCVVSCSEDGPRSAVLLKASGTS
jgi:3-oxoacyl-[acyl-carrier-protein] synthase-1